MPRSSCRSAAVAVLRSCCWTICNTGQRSLSTTSLRDERAAVRHISELATKAGETFGWFLRLSADTRKRFDRIVEHDDNRRFVITDDKQLSQLAEEERHAMDRQQPATRKLTAPVTRDYWDRMKAIRESAREVAVELDDRNSTHQRDAFRKSRCHPWLTAPEPGPGKVVDRRCRFPPLR